MACDGEFARLDAEGPYTRYSQPMAELLPDVPDRFAAQVWTLLDMACGEGTLAVAMAHRGFPVTGVDLSPHMLAPARARLAWEGLAFEFVQRDMRDVHYGACFDPTSPRSAPSSAGPRASAPWPGRAGRWPGAPPGPGSPGQRRCGGCPARGWRQR